MGRKFVLSYLGPAHLYIGVTWESFQMSGYIPSSKRLLNSFDIDLDICVAIKLRNFPEIPQ